MPTSSKGLHMMLKTLACQLKNKPAPIPMAMVQQISKTVTTTSDVKPLSWVISLARTLVMLPGARSSRSNQLIYLCMISSRSYTLSLFISLSPITANKLFSIAIMHEMNAIIPHIRMSHIKVSFSQSSLVARVYTANCTSIYKKLVEGRPPALQAAKRSIIMMIH